MAVINIPRDVVVYLISSIILTFYGVQVCPFIEKLTNVELATILIVSFAIVIVLRVIVLKLIYNWDKTKLTPWFYLVFDLSCWAFAGLLVTVWNFLNYEFPLESGLKIVLGSFAMGMFSATYIALDSEKQSLTSDIENCRKRVLNKDKFFSIANKFMLFVALSQACVGAILLLLVYKDFQYVIESINKGVHYKFIWVVQEILYVFGILVLGAFIVIKKYTNNLNLIFDLQIKVLRSVEQEEYNTFVPVVTNDELGIIAEHTNKMIEGLSEKKKIKDTFGKYMNPEIVKQILESKDGSKLGGKKREVALVFTDIRNFTSITENILPELLIKHLNEYFSLIVDVVRKNSGIVDKFIGDASLSVFGLSEACKGPECAFQAALEIQQELTIFNNNAEKNGLPRFDTGVGIHYGSVIVGNIGSRQRLEYTVIGDTVNAASRIESLTKEYNKKILVSREVYDELSESKKNSMEFIGDTELKGKSNKVSLYFTNM